MRLTFTSSITIMLLSAAMPVAALDSKIPPNGLPSAAVFSSQLLPELQGVVSWKTLGQVEPVQQGNKMVPQFSKEIMALDKKQVRVQGFILPMDMGDQQRHFLISAVPPHCPFCLPAGPDAVVEVLATKPIQYVMDPIILSGRLSVLKSDPTGILYRLSQAERIEA